MKKTVCFVLFCLVCAVFQPVLAEELLEFNGLWGAEAGQTAEECQDAVYNAKKIVLVEDGEELVISKDQRVEFLGREIAKSRFRFDYFDDTRAPKRLSNIYLVLFQNNWPYDKTNLRSGALADIRTLTDMYTGMVDAFEQQYGERLGYTFMVKGDDGSPERYRFDGSAFDVEAIHHAWVNRDAFQLITCVDNIMLTFGYHDYVPDNDVHFPIENGPEMIIQVIYYFGNRDIRLDELPEEYYPKTDAYPIYAYEPVRIITNVTTGF